jgi:hypothetical protein
MTNPPWWYSGDDGDDPDRDEPVMPRIDTGALIAAASQFVDWATERIVTPHAEHDDPSEHPTCVLCRSAAVIQGLSSGVGVVVETSTTPQPNAPSSVRWIPTTDRRDVEWD